MQMTEMKERHLPKVLAIYNYYVVNTTISFHTEPLSLDEMQQNTWNGHPRFKSYVMEEAGGMIGYALLAQHKNKQAYDVTAEITIYISPDHVGRQLGAEAVGFLEEQARQLGFHALVATICTENERSIRLFERLGYEKSAYFREVGRKFDRWLDVVSYQKIIGESKCTAE